MFIYTHHFLVVIVIICIAMASKAIFKTKTELE